MDVPPVDIIPATMENVAIPGGPPGVDVHYAERDAASRPTEHQQPKTEFAKFSRDPRAKRRVSRSPTPPFARSRRRTGRRSSSSSPDHRRRDRRDRGGGGDRGDRYDDRSDRGGGGGGGGDRYDDRSSARGATRRRSRSRDRGRSPMASRRMRRSRDRSVSPVIRGGGGRNRSPERGADRFRGGRRSRSLSRPMSSSRRNANNWSPSPMSGSGGSKKGPVSPPPLLPNPGPGQQQQQVYNPMAIYHGGQLPPSSQDGVGYNNFGPPPVMAPYGQVGMYGGGGYDDYGMRQGPPPPQQQQTFNAYVPTQMQPVPPGDEFQQAATNWASAPQQSQPPMQPAIAAAIIVPTETPEEEKQKREAAIEQEKKNQRATLRKQREDYRRRAAALKHEMHILKEQRDDLTSTAEPPSPTTKGFLKENNRLQLQIENKITTIENVIDMLSGIIGQAATPLPSPTLATESSLGPQSTSTSGGASLASGDKMSKRKSTAHERHRDDDGGGNDDDEDDDDDSSPERLKSKALQSLKRNKSEKSDVVEPSAPGTYTLKPADQPQQVNYVHYDPEMHWCQTCQVFPKTAKDFLTHLHTKDHQQQQKAVESPWHDHPLNDEMPAYPGAPTKRTPIRGLQFFVPTTGWYCRICAVWMGDLHCASLHLKSKTHARQYHDYAAQNPSFEVDWMSDRQRAYEMKREAPSAVSVAASSALSDQHHHHHHHGAVATAVASNRSVPGIPLQIQLSSQKGTLPTAPATMSAEASNAADEAAKKKLAKRRRKEERREKKKKKRSKKRKHRSSSSSSNSDSSNSDNETSSNTGGGSGGTAASGGNALPVAKEDSDAIRVAMRNLLKQQQQQQQLEDQLKEQQLAKQLDEQQQRQHQNPEAPEPPAASAEPGRWTVVHTVEQSPVPAAPRPPLISANGVAESKADDAMMAQWNEPPAVITATEKQLLDELKSRLKKRRSPDVTAAAAVKQTPPRDPPTPKRGASPLQPAAAPTNSMRNVFRDPSRDRDSRRRVASRSRSRSRDRNTAASGHRRGGRSARSRSRGGRVSRSRSRDRRRTSRSRSRGNGRRSRSRSRSRSDGRYGGRSSRRSRSRSRSRTRVSRVEKPIVRYPEFRPRVPETDGKDGKKSDERRSDGIGAKDKKLALKKAGASSASGVPAKKLPFIGRMPVFKKQTNDEEQRRDEEQQSAAAKTQAEKQQLQQQQQHQHHHNLGYGAGGNHHHHHQQHHQQHMYHYDGMQQMAPDDYDNLMPDPMQFVSMMVPPPPPPPPPPQQEQQNQLQHEQLQPQLTDRSHDNEPVLPPGIDAADADQVIKPISDAPLPRKGPLPQDFQDALSIIFPGERKPDDAVLAAADPSTESIAGDSSSIGTATTIAGSDQSTDAPAARMEPSAEAVISAPPVSAAEAQETAIAQAQAAAAAAAAAAHDEHSQHSLDLFSAFSVVNGVAVLNPELTGALEPPPQIASIGGGGLYGDEVDLMAEVPMPPHVANDDCGGGVGGGSAGSATVSAFEAENNGTGGDSNSRDDELKAARLEALSDMAMLGIDADDLAAQCM